MKKQTTPTICLNMIVKNEAKIIKRCLESVYKHIDTWCIVDTGSTDGTQEIIKEFLKDKPGILHERPWVNFGHNRNEALELGRKWGNWLLLTDADMVLVDKGFRKEELIPTYDVFDVLQDNNGTVYNNMRLLNTAKPWKCIGVTHEYYDCEGGVQSRGVINTLIFDDVSDGGSKDDKFERDIRLLEQGLIDEPENARYMFYLAQSYRDIQNYEKSIEWYTRRILAGGWDEEVWFSQYMIGWIHAHQDREFDIVASSLLKAWMMRPWRAEPVWILGMHARKKEMWQHAYQLLKSAATTPWPEHDVLFIAKGAYDTSVLDEFSIAAYYVGQFDECLQACSKLLNNPNLPQSEIPRIKRNVWFARKSLGLYNEESLNNYIKQKKEEL